MFDMHIHSTNSDGCLSPSEIFSKLKNEDMKGSITDHDNLEYYLNSKHDEFFIPGIEFGLTYKNEEVHILAYFIDTYDKELLDLTVKLQEDRNRRIHKTVLLLSDLGFSITYEEVERKSKGKILSRSHIGELLAEKGYTESIKESFQKYLNPGKPAYVDKKAMDVKEILRIIRDNKSVSILAHPKTIKDENTVIDIIKMGIDGLEVVNSKHQYQDVVYYIHLADKYHLLKTSGSDCHGKVYNGKMLLGHYGMNYKALEPIIHLHQLRKKGL